jgi:hypothetical protein
MQFKYQQIPIPKLERIRNEITQNMVTVCHIKGYVFFLEVYMELTGTILLHFQGRTVCHMGKIKA